MKISACAGRSAPPDSTRLISGRRLIGRDLAEPVALLQRVRVDRATAYGRIVGDDHALDALDHADAADDAAADRVVGREPGDRAQLQERRVAVDQQLDPLAWQQPAARVVPGHVLLTAAGAGPVQRIVQLPEPVQHGGAIVQIGGRPRVDGRAQDRHQVMTLLWLVGHGRCRAVRRTPERPRASPERPDRSRPGSRHRGAGAAWRSSRSRARCR